MYLDPQAPEVAALIDYARSMETVDTHQHLMAEDAVNTDLCRMVLQDNYIVTDLTTAGLSEVDKSFISDMEQPLIERWRRLRPYWRQVRLGSYARAILTTLQADYGAATLEAEAEVEQVSVRVTADFAAPGLFHRVFQEHCRIPIVLTQPAFIHGKSPCFYSLDRPLDRADFSPGGQFEREAASLGISLTSVADLAPAMDALLRQYHARGGVGYKNCGNGVA